MEDNIRVEDSRNMVGAEMGGEPAAGNDAGAAMAVPETAGEAQITEIVGAAAGNPAASANIAQGAAAETRAQETAKKPGIGKKIPGILELLAAAALLVLAGWMFYNTRGTRLLYVDVDFGRMCKYYWAPAAGALVFFAVGLYTLKRAGREVKKDGKLE